jgi:DNA-binding transcriptional MocR family regulator
LSDSHHQRHLNRLRSRLEDATALATERLQALGAQLFTRPTHSLYLWASLPGIDDSLTLASQLLPHKVVLAPGRVFTVDHQAPSPWSRFNVGAVCDPRFVDLAAPALEAARKAGRLRSAP